MKITVINGSMRHGSTWHAADTILRALSKRTQTQLTEFFLPRDMPHFCAGCFSCFLKGEAKCPHAASVQPIAEAILGADLVVLTSPVYALDVSGEMKALLDHLCYMWMSHRPAPQMFSKVGLTVVTTAGAGASHATKTLRNSLAFWGSRRIYSLKKPVAAMRWEQISEKNRAKIERRADALAARIERALRLGKRLPYSPFRAFLFKLMVGMQKKNDYNETDRAHWEKNGWLSGERPF